jgi:protein involved in polysaccharide export with SLBB domain
MKLRATLTILLGLIWATFVVGQQPAASNDDSPASSKTGTKPGGAAQAANFADRFPRYQLRSGDAFELNFQFSPELNQTVSVQPDGFVTLRGVGEMNVAGLTIPELKKRLEGAYGTFLNKPEISVVLRDFDKPYFIAMGMVSRPGKYELRGDVTVIEGIAMAGGLNDASKHSQVVLFRKASNDWFEAKVLNVKKMLASKDLSEDLHLKPGDIVYVPQNRISKFKHFIPSTGMGMSVTPPL